MLQVAVKTNIPLHFLVFTK